MVSGFSTAGSVGSSMLGSPSMLAAFPPVSGIAFWLSEAVSVVSEFSTAGSVGSSVLVSLSEVAAFLSVSGIALWS